MEFLLGQDRSPGGRTLARRPGRYGIEHVRRSRGV